MIYWTWYGIMQQSESDFERYGIASRSSVPEVDLHLQLARHGLLSFITVS